MTMALRDLVKRQGLVPGEYELHSGRIGGATRRAAGELRSWVIPRQGRWEIDAFMIYVRANREEDGMISRALACNAQAGRIQLGQGTLCGGGIVKNTH